MPSDSTQATLWSFGEQCFPFAAYEYHHVLLYHEKPRRHVESRNIEGFLLTPHQGVTSKVGDVITSPGPWPAAGGSRFQQKSSCQSSHVLNHMTEPLQLGPLNMSKLPLTSGRRASNRASEVPGLHWYLRNPKRHRSALQAQGVWKCGSASLQGSLSWDG